MACRAGFSKLIAKALAVAALLAAVPTNAQAPAEPPAARPEMMENCPGLIASEVPREHDRIPVVAEAEDGRGVAREVAANVRAAR